MTRSPLYQTRATIVLYPATRRRRLGLAASMVAGTIVVGMLFVSAGLAGDLAMPVRPAAATSANGQAGDSARSALIDTLTTAQPAQLPAQPAQPPASQPGEVEYEVVGVGDLGLLVRPEPGTALDPVETLLEGAVVTRIGADVTGADRAWRHIRDLDGVEGWIAAEYTQPMAPSTP